MRAIQIDHEGAGTIEAIGGGVAQRILEAVSRVRTRVIP